jgi:hypothetical protein
MRLSAGDARALRRIRRSNFAARFAASMGFVPRLNRLLAAGVAVLALAALGAGGCGGSSKPKATTGATDHRKPPRSAEIPPPRLHASDRKAYAAIQKASGDLRAAVTPLAYGAASRIETTDLTADARKLERLAPRSPRLQGLREQSLSALQSVIGRAPTKAIATAAIGEADRIDDGLRRYAASNPAANEIAPG